MKLKMLFVLLPVCLTGCATSQDELLPVGDQTMVDIWQKGGGQTGQGSATLMEARNALQFVRPVESAEANYSENNAYTRTATNEATNLFPRLPNPDLSMFIFPHLTDHAEPMPVPGYTTVFPFYGRVQYAQPGERTRQY
ncbi:TIGR03751 family conjugal transfer lipoprotein [uncultured Actinobacillus sp.]|uniref:TIGR03751 family conjugal transfer lipoprotein n=1 Tax=uncultured Actinobacillus sp. TaxID=417616 RepID=UPI002354C5F5|nr:TIGR03751 family conjugal transfer lipoprotein [uncultured Actinobacillus sp.]